MPTLQETIPQWVEHLKTQAVKEVEKVKEELKEEKDGKSKTQS